MNLAAQAIISNTGTLSERLSALHSRLLQTIPGVDRIACTLYESKDDTLKTYINSTRQGTAIQGYEARLSQSAALFELAQKGNFRVLDDIEQAIHSNSTHSQWLREQGYRSSFTVPFYDNAQLLGFIFFDSMQAGAFTPQVQRDLVLYTSLISMLVSGELAAIRMVVESTRVARQLTEVRDFETGAHLDRMAHYARLIARKVAPTYGLDDEFTEAIFLFAPLHDIGKIGIPDRILLKPGKLDDDERRTMNAHVDKGVAIIDRIIGDNSQHRFPDSSILRNIIACHHEMLDGSGYPKALQGDDIPLEARIVAVADIFDALTSERPYKAEWPLEQAFEELHRLSGEGKLDAECVHALASQADTVKDIRARYADAAGAH
ncbi:HD-GYP domain-containing protein [Aquabacterium sp.]|uniref:HD-GYP domain-containing protein n=1 Tax=Aquabacterium sp. TaxID=1872578 RepID=UPI003B6A4012